MPQYGECDYWDERYSREPAAFDWYQGFSGLSAILQHVFSMHATLLQVGVGSSRVQEDMVRAGWRRIVNIDYSRVVINHMAELHRGIPGLEYRVADARQMPEFADGCFDGVLDKGTLDAILCGERSTLNAVAMVAECYRVLRPGGAFMLITYGDPASRLPYLEDIPGWSIVVYALTKQEMVEALEAEPVVRALIKGPYPATNADCMDALSGLEGMHFVYVCRKADPPSVTALEPEPQPEEAAPQPQPHVLSKAASRHSLPYPAATERQEYQEQQTPLEPSVPLRSTPASPAEEDTANGRICLEQHQLQEQEQQQEPQQQGSSPLLVSAKGRLESAPGPGSSEASDEEPRDDAEAGDGGTSTDPEAPEGVDREADVPPEAQRPLVA